MLLIMSFASDEMSFASDEAAPRSLFLFQRDNYSALRNTSCFSKLTTF
jgi:hypothetical protein